MNIDEFQNILNNSESEILDFKQEQYEFLKNSNESNSVKFVKDIISFSNTIRKDTAYIILGVRILENGEKNLIGIDNHIDDAIFQDKIKDKVTPIPYFKYSIIKYDNKYFGVFEIPVKKYKGPIFSTVRMKGLDPGKVYFRRGSSNSEATGNEIILINKWFESMPEIVERSNFKEEVADLMIKTTSNNCSLSEQIALSLKLAHKYNLNELLFFCQGELSGWYDEIKKNDLENYLFYRILKVVMTPNEIEVNPYSFHSLTSQQMLDEIIRIDKNAFESKLLFPEPITKIENYLKQFPTGKNNSLMVISHNAEKLFGNSKYSGMSIKTYVTEFQLTTIYQQIRQKLITLLLSIS